MIELALAFALVALGLTGGLFLRWRHVSKLAETRLVHSARRTNYLEHRIAQAEARVRALEQTHPGHVPPFFPSTPDVS